MWTPSSVVTIDMIVKGISIHISFTFKVIRSLLTYGLVVEKVIRGDTGVFFDNI